MLVSQLCWWFQNYFIFLWAHLLSHWPTYVHCPIIYCVSWWLANHKDCFITQKLFVSPPNISLVVLLRWQSQKVVCTYKIRWHLWSSGSNPLLYLLSNHLLCFIMKPTHHPIGEFSLITRIQFLKCNKLKVHEIFLSRLEDQPSEVSDDKTTKQMACYKSSNHAQCLILS